METCYLLDNCEINAFREALTKVGFMGQFNDEFKFPLFFLNTLYNGSRRIHKSMCQRLFFFIRNIKKFYTCEKY